MSFIIFVKKFPDGSMDVVGNMIEISLIFKIKFTLKVITHHLSG